MQNVSPSFGMPAAPKQGMSPAMRSRLVLICLPLLTLALIGGGIYGMQVASQRGLDLGFPTPQVHITSSIPNSVSVGQQVTFTADSAGRDLSYSWDFGDGSRATGPNVSHAFQQTNSYTVTVTVKDAAGHISTASMNITVQPTPPVASFIATPGSFGSPSVTVDASGSTIGTSSATYNWDFGDGFTDTQTVPTDQHTYNLSGTYTITLTITDSAGQTSPAVTQQVTV
jgi:PKD repeat protein